MPINWDVFKNNLLSYFESNKNSQNTSDIANQVASKIADEYEAAVLQGGDAVYGNVLVTYNKSALSLAIEQAFRQGFGAQSIEAIKFIYGNNLATGLIGFWSGAQLGFIIPPPPSITVISNPVLSPGTPGATLSWNTQTENREEFLDALVDYFKQHLQTLSGITTSLVPQPTGPPLPFTYPWTGYL